MSGGYIDDGFGKWSGVMRRRKDACQTIRSSVVLNGVSEVNASEHWREVNKESETPVDGVSSEKKPPEQQFQFSEITSSAVLASILL